MSIYQNPQAEKKAEKKPSVDKKAKKEEKRIEKEREKAEKVRKQEIEQKAKQKAKADKKLQNRKWWSEVVTDRTTSLVLIISLMATVLLTAYSTIIFKREHLSLFCEITIALSLFFFIAAQWIMYHVYNMKDKLEKIAWNKKMKNQPDEIIKLETKFQKAYQDSVWIKHTPPFALVIYILIISIGFVTISLSLQWKNWLDYFILGVMLAVTAMITTKFINDIYNLLNNFKKMKGLSELK